MISTPLPSSRPRWPRSSAPAVRRPGAADEVEQTAWNAGGGPAGTAARGQTRSRRHRPRGHRRGGSHRHGAHARSDRPPVNRRLIAVAAALVASSSSGSAAGSSARSAAAAAATRPHRPATSAPAASARLTIASPPGSTPRRPRPSRPDRAGDRRTAAIDGSPQDRLAHAVLHRQPGLRRPQEGHSACCSTWGRRSSSDHGSTSCRQRLRHTIDIDLGRLGQPGLGERLKHVASSTKAVATTKLSVTGSAKGHYVLLWFTKLPVRNSRRRSGRRRPRASDRLMAHASGRQTEVVPDAELLARHVQGEPQAFGDCSCGTGTGCGRSRCGRVGDPEEAADALQDAMISAFRRGGRFRGDSAVTTWLHRIVVNACLDRLRRKAAAAGGAMGDDAAPRLCGRRRRHQERRPDVRSRDSPWTCTAALRALPTSSGRRWSWSTCSATRWPTPPQMLDVPVGTIKSRCARGRARLLPLLGTSAGTGAGSRTTSNLRTEGGGEYPG